MSRKREMIKIKTNRTGTDYLYLEGTILEKNQQSLLMEKISIRQKDENEKVTLSPNFITNEQSKPFVVIRLSETDDVHQAEFFDDVHQARIFYENLS